MTGVAGSPACAITLTTTPTDADFAAIFHRLDGETAPVIGPCQIQPLVLLLHGESDEIVGGLWGRTVYAWLVIEMLFVPAALRGTGTGTALLRAAEAEASARRCIGIQITRLEFQAPSFYEKHGFTVFGRQDDVPPGHRCFYMEKRIGPDQ